ncbi:MAG TPA: hypothetical protein VKU38_20955 [Ktedonobacteraceae bacterium]|nr:hypothetical protein [Ktedonobacteraceae bacterium]
MNHLSVALASRYLVVLLVVLLVLLLLTVFLIHAHSGGMPSFVQSTDSILD